MADKPIEWSERQYAGMAWWNHEVRYVFSPPTSIWDDVQRAEFVRFVAEGYGVGERNVRTWFSQNQRQTPFLRKDLPRDTFIGRVILTKCLVFVPDDEQTGRQERVLIKGNPHNLNGVPFRPLLENMLAYRETFHWEFNSHEWNPNGGDTIDDITAFVLIWYYGYYNVPGWLPEQYRPTPGFDSDPFGPVTSQPVVVNSNDAQ